MKLNNMGVRGTSAQYDGFSAGEFGTSVNLFKGEASFDYPLVTGTPVKNGIGIHISASYSSNTDKASRSDNLSEPTGVLGLGWQFGFPVIMRADTGQILPPESEIFYYNDAGGLSRLYQTGRNWLLATLAENLRPELEKPDVSPVLAAAFSEQGIAVTQGSAITFSEDCYTIVDVTEESELCILPDSDAGYRVYSGGMMFETANYDFSRIVYYPQFEKWLIVQKDGLRKIFGGSGNNGVLQFIVHYNGAVVPSKCTDNQERAVLQWNLSKELSIWDDEVDYSYLQDTQPVGSGGLEYTKACYLNKITDMFGYCAELNYGDKIYTADTKEYIDPQFPDADQPITGPSCYQNRYETRFLTEIRTYDPAGNLIESIGFGYDVMQLSGNSAIPGGNAKRLLTSVTRTLTTKGPIPPELFTYVTGQGSNLGGLESITTAAGTAINYSYIQKQLTQCSNRSTVVSKESYTEKKVWNGPDYSAVLLYNESTSLFRIYGWVGRFQTWTPPEQPFVNVYDLTEAIVLDDAVIVYSSSEADNTTKVVCYRENPDILGSWTVEATEVFPSARCSVAAGNNWFIVNERDNGRLSLYTYDLLNRKTVKSVQTLDASHAYLVASNGNSYALLDYDVDGVAGYKSSALSIFTLDGFGNWSQTAAVKLPDITAVYDTVNKTAALFVCFSGVLCSVAAVNSTNDRIFYYDVTIWKLGSGITNIYCNSFSVNCGKNVWEAPSTSWQPEIYGQIIVSGGTVLAFDGKEIRENTSLSTAGFDLQKGAVLQAVGTNCVLQSRITDDDTKEVLAQALLYDPDHADSFSTAAPIQVYYERPDQLKDAGYVPSICGKTAVFDDMVYSLYAAEPFRCPLVTLDDCRSGSLINGGNFLAYSDESGATKSIRIINGIPAPANILAGELPDTPNGSTVFSTENSSSLIIFVNTGDSFNEPVSNYQISRIIADDGFSKTGKAYVYDENSAVCDSSGRFAKYYVVDVYNQYNNDIGFTRYRYCNSLAEVLPSDNSTVPYATDGQLLDTTVFDENRNILSQTTFQYDIMRSVAESPGAGRTLTIYGAVTSSAVSSSTEGGVISIVKTEYDPYNGETSAVTTTSSNVFGDEITTTRRSYPAAAEYPLLACQNRVAEPGRTTTEWKKNDGAPQIVEAKSVAFNSVSNGKRSIFIGSKTLLWNGNGDPDGVNAADWQVRSSINAIDSTGNIIEQETPQGILQSQVYGADGFLLVGSATDASVLAGEMMICTFEEYENIPLEWKNYIVNVASFAGASSLRIPPNSEIPAMTRLLPKGEYAAAFWSTGAAKLTISGQGVSISAEHSPQDTSGIEYHLIRFTVDAGRDVKFVFGNDFNSDAFVEVFSISPFGNPPVINVYKNYLLDAGISSYREYTRYIRDRRNNIIALINEKSAPSLTVPFYHRLSELQGESSRYNAEMVIKFTGGSNYEPVSSSNRTLTLPVSSSADTETAAVYVDVRGEDSPAITFGNVTVGFANGLWTLSAGGAVNQAEGKTADGEWVLLVGKQLLFFFNGECVFSMNSTDYDKPLTLTLSGNVSYTKLLYGPGVSFGIRYLDTAGRVRQGQMFNNSDVTVTQNFYDDENHLIAQSKPVVLTNIPFGYIDDFAVLDRTTGIMSGRIADAYPEDEGFPYVGQIFESTPLGRQIESGLPGKAYAINPVIPQAQRQTVRLSYTPVHIPGLSLPNGRYHYMVTTSPEGNRSVSVINTEKQQVAIAALGENSAIISASNTEYHGAARIETDYLPVYFDGNASAIRVKHYDFRGNLISKTDPNQDGATTYCYNVFNEQRFMQTPELAASGRFVYQKYDKLHRVTEEGLCSDAWEEAIKSADDADYPAANIVILRAYEYGNDINDIGSLSSLIAAQAFQEDGTLCSTESYTYDTAGRRNSNSLHVPEVETSFTEACKYDGDGNIISTTSAAGNQLFYTYDCAGRMTVEKTSGGSSVTAFSYCANDMIASVKTSGGTTEYGYTSTGWINHIQSPLMEETIRYSGTRISEFTVHLKVNSPTVPSSVRYLVSYDEFGRMASALCYNNDTLLEEISITSVTYDKNGNIRNAEIGGRLRNYLYQAGSDRILGVDDDNGFTYNADGSITSAQSAGIDSIEYSHGKPVFFRTKAGNFDLTYDMAGNRLTKATAGGKTIFLYNNQSRISEEITLPGGDIKQYLYGQFGLRAIIDRNGIKDVYTDHLGSPRIIGNQGQAVAAAHYTPFGKAIPVMGSMAFGFNGYGCDAETGLYYSSYRLYDPETGRFYSLDPQAGGESPYIFCGNDPVNRIDPDGDSWWGILLGAVVGIVGIAATVVTAGLFLPAAMASETALVTETVVGAVAGAVGSVAGTLVTAACDKEPITGKMVVGALVSGAIGGLGSLAGPLGQFTMRTMMRAGATVGKITAAGIITGCTVGAAAGVGGSLAYSAITDTPISGVSIAMAGLAGAGTGLLATRAAYGLMKPGGTKTLPVMIDSTETGVIRDGTQAMGRNVNIGNAVTNVRDAFQRQFGNDKFYSFIDDATFDQVGTNMLRGRQNPFKVSNGAGGFINGERNAAVVTCHGFGRHCFVISDYKGEKVWRPVKGSTFVSYFAHDPRYTGTRDQNVSYVKLLICFSGSRPGFSSTAQKFATALRKTTYGTRGIAYPQQLNQQYLRFV